MITAQQRQARNAEADALLAGLSIDQLRAGLKRGRDQLAVLEADEAIDQQAVHDNIGHPGQHPSKDYVAWSESFTTRRRMHLQSAIRDVTAELARRGEIA